MFGELTVIPCEYVVDVGRLQPLLRSGGAGASGDLRATVVKIGPRTLRAAVGVFVSGLGELVEDWLGDTCSASASRAIAASRARIWEATVASSILSSLPSLCPVRGAPDARCAMPDASGVVR